MFLLFNSIDGVVPQERQAGDEHHIAIDRVPADERLLLAIEYVSESIQAGCEANAAHLANRYHRELLLTGQFVQFDGIHRLVPPCRTLEQLGHHHAQADQDDLAVLSGHRCHSLIEPIGFQAQDGLDRWSDLVVLLDVGLAGHRAGWRDDAEPPEHPHVMIDVVGRQAQAARKLRCRQFPGVSKFTQDQRSRRVRHCQRVLSQLLTDGLHVPLQVPTLLTRRLPIRGMAIAGLYRASSSCPSVRLRCYRSTTTVRQEEVVPAGAWLAAGEQLSDSYNPLGG